MVQSIIFEGIANPHETSIFTDGCGTDSNVCMLGGRSCLFPQIDPLHDSSPLLNRKTANINTNANSHRSIAVTVPVAVRELIFDMTSGRCAHFKF